MKKGSLGLTLIELLLALGIFSILAVLAYGGINSVLNTREAVLIESTRLAAVQRSYMRLSRDLGQISPRAIRDVHGDVQPALQTGSEVYSYKNRDAITGKTTEGKAEILIEFTVAGKRLLPGQQRSSLQRVGYAVNGKDLLRLNWSVLDRAQDSEPYVSVILSDVNKLAFRYLTVSGDWQNRWPDENASLLELPVAVEVTFEDEKWGKLRRVFLVS